MKPIKHTNYHTYQQAIEHALELSGPQEVFFAEYQAKIITELLIKQECKPVAVLDYGCGDGTLASIVSQLLPEARIHGIDIAEELIEIAQEWYGTENDKTEFWQTTDQKL